MSRHGRVGIRRDLRDAIQHRPLEIQLEHHAKSARQRGVERHRKVQAEHATLFEQILERRQRPRLARAAAALAYALRGGQNAS